jgi:import inner membrane translocase subunit TIM16
MFRGKAMTLHEARQVLDVKEHDDPEKVNEAFERLYFSNAVQNNGSFYIQSKIYRAKQSMDIHFEMQKELEDEPGVASPKGPQ